MNNLKRNVIIAAVVTLLVLSVGLVAAELIPDADELMLGAVETLETVEDGHAVVTFTVETPEEDFAGTIEVWGQREFGPNGEPGLRIEVLDAPEAEMIGVTAVTDGVEFWLYDPNQNTVVVGTAAEMAAALAEKAAEFDGHDDFDRDAAPELPEDFEMPETPEEAIALLLEYFMAERNGGEMMAGADAYRLRLVPIPEQMPDEVRAAGGFLNLWLRESDQLPVGVEYAEGALGYGRIEAVSAEINMGLDPSTFYFAIPDGATVIRAIDLLDEFANNAAEFEPAEGTEVIEPETEATALPADAVIGELQRVAGVTVQRYDRADGLSFVVAQGPVMPFPAPEEAVSETTITVQGVEGTLYENEDGSRILLLWQVGDTMYAVGGDISADEALAVANSIE